MKPRAKRNPCQLEMLLLHSAESAKSLFTSQKKYMAGLEVSQATASRRFNGDAGAPETKFLEQVVEAGGDIWPIITRAITLAYAPLEFVSLRELESRHEEIDEHEHELDSNEDRHTLRAGKQPTPARLEDAGRADVQNAEILLRRAALRFKLAERIRSVA